jgi:acylphosphatase
MSQEKSSQRERRVVYFSGRVQGVGFRFTTQRIAQAVGVVGYVENLADGRVHAVAEGASADIEQFLARLSSEMGRYIQATDTSTATATGEFAEFSIRH